MKKMNHSNPCKQVRNRQGLWASLKERACRHLADHIATCPRCQKRLALVNRVELAMSLVKSQQHNLDLLARANAKAIGVLKHSLRNTPKTEQLRHSKPDCHWIERKRPVIERLLNIAACLFVVMMIRMGVTSLLTNVQTKGKTALHNYYARNLDSGLVNEIFPDDTAHV
ncbi:MAG: hypothetical protein ISS71_00780 [Phycisphaerae bacterium]|nr:hypothetical protein [Phycisphaerae bacterium]